MAATAQAILDSFAAKYKWPRDTSHGDGIVAEPLYRPGGGALGAWTGLFRSEPLALLTVRARPPAPAPAEADISYAYSRGARWLVQHAPAGPTQVHDVLRPDGAVVGDLQPRWTDLIERACSGLPPEVPEVDTALLMDLKRARDGLLHIVTVDQGSARVVDNWFFRFIAACLLARVTEDRGLSTVDCPPIGNASGATGGKPDALRRTLGCYARSMNSDLLSGLSWPDWVHSPEVAETLSNAVGCLYRLQSADRRLDFRALSPDFIGRFYEKLLGWEGRPRESVQRSLFPTLDFEAVDVRRRRGVYYTPRWVAEVVVALTVPTSPPQCYRVVDPCCGSGTFLLSALRWLSGTSGSRSSLEALHESVFGADVDERAVAIAKANLQMAVASPGARFADLSPNVQCLDALRELEPSTYDAVVTNPPWGWSPRTLSDAEIASLRSTYATASGKFDVSAVFIEAAFRALKPGGRLGAVVPNRLLTSPSARPLRELLGREGSVERVVDFSDVQLFEGALTYPAILVVAKNGHGPRVIKRFDRVSELLATRSPGQALVGTLRKPAMWIRTNRNVSLEPDGAGWSAPPSPLLARIISAFPHSLSSVTGPVFQGLRTGNNKAFVLDNVRQVSPDRVEGDSALLGTRVALETGLVSPFVYGRDLLPYCYLEGSHRLIVPYHPDGTPMPWEEIDDRYPATARYLRRCGLADGDWFVRDRGITRFMRVNLVTQQVTSQIGFSKLPAGVFFASGTGIQPPDDDRADLLLGLLNSSLIRWVVEQLAKPHLHGSHGVSVGLIQGLPMPDPDRMPAGLKDRIAGHARKLAELHAARLTARAVPDIARAWAQVDQRQEALDEAVLELSGVDPREYASILRTPDRRGV